MAKEIFTVIDFETTGLDPENEQIIEVAAVKTDLDQIYSKFEARVRLEEGRTLSDFITELTGITEGDLTAADVEPLVLLQLAFFINNTTVVAQYAPFDLSFMARYSITPEFFLCTRTLARMIDPDKSASLKNVAPRYGVSLEGHHRAMNDVEATAALLPKLLKAAEEKGIDRKQYQNVVLNFEDRPLRFIPKYAVVKNEGFQTLSPEELEKLKKQIKQD